MQLQRIVQVILIVAGYFLIENETVTAIEASHVVLVSIDGLRPDAIDKERTPTIVDLIDHSAFTLEAQSHAPTLTIPNHVSMLTGMTPSVHGITDSPREFTIDTVADSIKIAGMTVGLYLSKDKLSFLTKHDKYDRNSVTETGVSDETVNAFVADFSSVSTRWSFSMIHLIEADFSGHRYGWMSASYLSAVKACDMHLARIIKAIQDAQVADSTVIIVTADHGGINFAHDSTVPEVTNVPWIIVGPGIRNGWINATVQVVDTAATVLAAFGLPVSANLEGQVPLDVITPPFVRGDVDGDLNHSITDGIALLNYLFRMQQVNCLEASDVDSNGVINITDAIYILNLLFRGGSFPMAPYPDCAAVKPVAGGCLKTACNAL